MIDHRAILENAPLPILVHQDETIRYVNPAGLALLGMLAGSSALPAEAVIGTDIWRWVAPDEHPAVRQHLAELFGGKRCFRNTFRTLVDPQGNRFVGLASGNVID